MRRYLLVVGLAVLLNACEQNQNSQQAVPPTITRFDVSATEVAVGKSVTYTWQTNVSDASCRLDVANDGIIEYTRDCTVGSQAHTFTNPGSFPATLTVTAAGQDVTQNAPVVTVKGPSATFTNLSWQPLASPPYGIAEGQSVSLGGKLYVFGGFDSESPYRCCRPADRTYVFDPTTEVWQPLAPLPPMNGAPSGGVNHAGFTTDGHDIFFAGGYTASLTDRAHIFGTREAWRYNVADNSYTRLPDLPEVRGAGQLEFYDGRLYFFGGSNENRKTDTGELYILDLNEGATAWREGAPLPNPRNHLGAAVLGGKIYAIAGQHKHDGKLTTQDDVHAYDPKTDSWEQVASLPLAVSHNSNSTFVMGGRIINIGGEVGHLKGVANVFAYDPKTNSWTELTPLPKAMVDPVADNVGGQIIVSYNWEPETYLGTPLD